MAKYKVTFAFENQGNGWSETHFTDAANINAAYNNAFLLAGVRSDGLADPAALQYIRISDVVNPRLTSITSFLDNPFQIGNWTSESDEVAMAAEFEQYASTTGYTKKTYLHGIPDDVFDLSQPNAVDRVTWTNWLNGPYNGQITNGNWYVRSRDRSNGNPSYPIVNVSTDIATGYMEISAGPTTPNLAVGSYIVIYGMRGVKPVPGLVRIVTADNTAKIYVVQYSMRNKYTISGVPTFKVLSYVYNVITSTNLVRIATHKVGRPFGLSRGARPAIPRRAL